MSHGDCYCCEELPDVERQNAVLREALIRIQKAVIVNAEDTLWVPDTNLTVCELIDHALAATEPESSRPVNKELTGSGNTRAVFSAHEALKLPQLSMFETQARFMLRKELAELAACKDALKLAREALEARRPKGECGRCQSGICDLCVAEEAAVAAIDKVLP